MTPPAPKRDGFGSNPWELLAAALLVIIALIGVAALLAVLLSDSSEEFTGDVRILSPKDKATVTGPFVLKVESPTYRIADPAEGIAGAAHFHVFVDIHPFTASGQVIPQKEGVYHFFTDTLPLDLQPGEHRIILVLGDNDDVRIPGATVTGISVTVQ